MSRFFSDKYKSLEAYVPGEQPKDMKYVKLNTNESPYPPTDKIAFGAMEEAKKLQLYSDPECTYLNEKLAEIYGVKKEQVLVTNGSDEALNFAFMAFCDKDNPIVFPNITYGFYPVFANLNGIPFYEIPLREDFKLDYKDYLGICKNIVIANPNAPTGCAIPLSDIEQIVKSNKDNIVIIDEAYVDFGAESAVKLIDKYDNLIVIQTFSKSRSLAGARVGFAISNKDIIADLNTIKFSTNPYNVNRMSMMAAYLALCDNDYFMNNCKEIIKARDYTKKELEKLGFLVLDSSANFIFAKSNKISGFDLYKRLKEKGILVRHFEKEEIKEYNRITIGTKEQMDIFLKNVRSILEEIK